MTTTQHQTSEDGIRLEIAAMHGDIEEIRRIFRANPRCVNNRYLYWVKRIDPLTLSYMNVTFVLSVSLSNYLYLKDKLYFCSDRLGFFSEFAWMLQFQCSSLSHFSTRPGSSERRFTQRFPRRAFTLQHLINVLLKFKFDRHVVIITSLLHKQRKTKCKNFAHGVKC